MSVIPVDLGTKPVNWAAKLLRFGHRLTEWLDALGAYPIKNSVSEQTLRRVDEDIKHCQDLMSKNRQQEAVPKFGSFRPERAIRAIKFS